MSRTTSLRRADGAASPSPLQIAPFQSRPYSGRLASVSGLAIFLVLWRSVRVFPRNRRNRIQRKQNIALFSTHGALTGLKLSREALEQSGALASGAVLLGTFTCRGRVPYSVLEALGKKPAHKAWVEMPASARHHPDASDLAQARVFAKWISHKASAQR